MKHHPRTGSTVGEALREDESALLYAGVCPDCGAEGLIEAPINRLVTKISCQLCPFACILDRRTKTMEAGA